MAKEDLAISRDDLSDIFGGDIPLAAAGAPEIKNPEAKEVLPEKPEYVEQPEKSRLIVNTKAGEMAMAEKIVKEHEKSRHEYHKEEELDADELTKRAEEIRMQMEGPAVPAVPAEPAAKEELSFPDFLDEKKLTDIFSIFDELRRVMKQELAFSINEKTVNNMLLRTLEKSALSSVLLKNTNWDSTGRLREDGSIALERVIKNMGAFGKQIGEIDKEVENALMSLFTLRVKSVKMGMGAPAFNSLKDKITKKLTVIEAGYGKAAVNFIKEKVVVPGFRKGDEAK